jgi:hypothetical protein
MAFKTAQTASEAFSLAKNLAAGVKALAQSHAAAFASTTNRDMVLSMVVLLRQYRVGLAAASAVPGVLQYAKDQYDDQNYNIGTEFTAMLSAIDAVIAEVHSAFPVDNTGGEVKERVLNADGSITLRTFTSAQLANVRTLLQTLDGAISA